VTPIVLVHGAWHGGWCWSRVVPRLWNAGHRAYAPTLTGLGERAHLYSAAITLDTHVTDIVNAIAYEGLHDVVLCGHSYGGFVISGVIERLPERIASAVFLDAFVPSDGESMFDLVANRSRQLESFADGGALGVPPIPAHVFNVNEADRDYVDAQCVMQPIGTFAQKISLTGAVDRVPRRSYVRAAEYRSAPFDRARGIALERGWNVYDVAAGHDVMLDAPERLAEILLAEA
jgi:pimeloyl-ACP methyl ester carboxylesterase